MVKLRLPKLDAPTPQGQMKQLYSYLYQLIGELQSTLDRMEQELSERKVENEALREEIQRLNP